MADNSINGFDKNTTQLNDIIIPRSFRFWFFLVLDVPSIYCSLILLFYLFLDKNLRHQLSNHVISVLLIMGLAIQLIDIPFHLAFLHLGFVGPSVPATCVIWWFIDVGLYNGCTLVMAWSSIQRYLLIFHDHLFSTRRKRFLFHYVPTCLFMLYIVIFYLKLIVFPSCRNTYVYSSPVCNYSPCYLNDPVLSLFDSTANSILPTLIIGVASVSLLISVYFQKRRLNQNNVWRKQRKMTFQLLSNSILYLVPNIPLNIVIFANFCGLPYNISMEAQFYFNFLCDIGILLFPFVCLGILTGVRRKLRWKGMLTFQQPNQTVMVRPR